MYPSGAAELASVALNLFPGLIPALQDQLDPTVGLPLRL